MKKNRAFIVIVVFLALLLGSAYVDIWGVDANGTGSAQDIKLGLDLAGGVSITYEVVGDEAPSATDMSDTISKLQQRVWNYSTEATVYQEGTDRISIEIPGVTDANAILEELGKPGALYFISETDAEGNTNYSTQSTGVGYVTVLDKTIEELQADGSIVLVGTDVASATAGSFQDNLGNQDFAVDLTLTDEGTSKFAVATEKAYNAGETIGIYYDGEFVSVPKVNAVLTAGTAQITGMASYEEAEQLASTIRIGGLKLELEELHSKVVGAQLGVEAISTSLKAGLIGLIIVIVFMLVVYRLPGAASSLALLLYTSLTILLIYGFDMTLTLSGIAGVLLSIGMAVDGNVIIFARIREELAAGQQVHTAIKVGFKKAFSAILDGNVTTIIAALILMWMGPGSVKGFGQTLILGNVLSMFTALTVTRQLLYAFYALGAKSKKWYGESKERKTIDFLSKRKIFFGLSLGLILAGCIVMVVNFATTGDALNYSLEFKGGTATTVTFDKPMTLEEINRDVVPLVEESTGSTVQIQTVQDSNEVIFKTNTLDVAQREALNQVMLENFGVSESLITSETISSTISSEMSRDTVVALLLSLICILIYVRIRFSDIRFGISSVAALFHDALIVVFFYAVSRISVGNAFVACILTIVGYSMNATVVIFDRIRENLTVMGKNDDLQNMVNRSITQTLVRSIFTSLTTFFMVLVLYILGVTSIKEFALPLMVGILCGTYSSVCLTGAMWFVMKKAGQDGKLLKLKKIGKMAKNTK
jgi:SecD/SecF fusion protein